MKRSLLALTLITCSMVTMHAQCTIQNSCTPSTTTGYCSTPAAGTALPNGTEGVAYSTTIQLSLGTTAAGGFVTITNATVTAITGLPTGLTSSTNPSNGVINGGSDGCILISGTPAVGSAGTYSVNAAVTVNTSAGAQATNLIWALTINTAAGIATVSGNQGVVYVMPNPATTQITIASDFHFQTVRVYDALGNLSLSQDANNSSKTSVDLGKLSAGIYFVQVTDGTRSITRKFVKE